MAPHPKNGLKKFTLNSQGPWHQKKSKSLQEWQNLTIFWKILKNGHPVEKKCTCHTSLEASWWGGYKNLIGLSKICFFGLPTGW